MNSPSVRQKEKENKPPKLRKDGKPAVHTTQVERTNIKKQIKKWILQGKAYADVIENIMNEYDYSEDSACNIFTQANREVKEYMEQHKNDILDVQMKRLEAVIEDTFEHGDYKNLLKATDQLSKLANLYEQRVKVEADNFQIKIG